jgi:uncharacterized integral membrane protein
MRIVVWLFRALVFFALFAFALNNQHDATIHWFFGHSWVSPMAIVVLIAFAIGCVFGVLAMVPSWWRQRRVARRHGPAAGAPLEEAPLLAPSSAGSLGETTLPQYQHPPRDGI